MLRIYAVLFKHDVRFGYAMLYEIAILYEHDMGSGTAMS